MKGNRTMILSLAVPPPDKALKDRATSQSEPAQPAPLKQRNSI